MKKLICVLAAAALLAGCGSLRWLPSSGREESAPSVPAEPIQEDILWVWLQDGAAMPDSVSAYARARGVQVRETPDPAQAGLALLTACPQGGYRPLDTEPLLAGAASGSDGAQAVPVVMGRYGYLANTEALREMLGGADALQDLCAADYEEWEAFVEAASGWIYKPREKTIELNGNTYTLAAEKGPATESLDDVFAVDCREGFGAPALSPALAAAGENPTREALTGPLNSVWYTFRLETDHLAGAARGGEAIATIDAATARAFFEAGEALFLRCRAGAQDAVVPMKFNFETGDLTAESWSVQALAQTPIEAAALWAAVPADAPAERADQGLGYLLWLYTSNSSPLQGDPVRCVPAAVLTAEQEQMVNAALAAELESKTWNTADRKAYVAFVQNVLVPEAEDAGDEAG